MYGVGAPGMGIGIGIPPGIKPGGGPCGGMNIGPAGIPAEIAPGGNPGGTGPPKPTPGNGCATAVPANAKSNATLNPTRPCAMADSPEQQRAIETVFGVT
jgi:hypothetical protein